MRKSQKCGITLLMVLPVILLLFLLGLFFIESLFVLTGSDTTQLFALRMKYAEISAKELVLLEMIECGSLASNVKKDQTEADVTITDTIPAEGTMFYGGNSSIIPFGYSQISSSQIQIKDGSPLKQPIGTTLYLCRDLDGNGIYGSIEGKRFDHVKLHSNITSSLHDTYNNPIQFESFAVFNQLYRNSRFQIYFP